MQKLIDMEKLTVQLTLVLALAVFSTSGIAGSLPHWDVNYDLRGARCKPRAGFGPYDYTNARHRNQHLRLVEDTHFTPSIEALKQGNTGTIAADLEYTLRAFPNHHRAMYSLYRFATIPSFNSLGSLRSPPECYFQRGIKFKEGDYIIRTLYGQYLLKTDHFPEAKKQLEEAVKLKPRYKKARYYLALTLVELGELPEAQKYAKALYKEGYRAQRLRQKLEEAGFPVDAN